MKFDRKEKEVEKKQEVADIEPPKKKAYESRTEACARKKSSAEGGRGTSRRARWALHRRET